MKFGTFTLKLADLWLRSYSRLSEVELQGPAGQGSLLAHEIIRFRTQKNLEHARYLEESHQLRIEHNLKIDERSLHFALKKEGKIVACVRVTPFPFEFSALAQPFADQAEKFHTYYEFSRLCTDSALERKGFHVGLLVVKAALHLFSKTSAQGIVGICKENRIPYMNKLGLHHEGGAVCIAERNDHYQMIHATQSELISFYFKRFTQHLFSKTQTKDSNPIHTQEKTHEPRIAEKQSREPVWTAS